MRFRRAGLRYSATPSPATPYQRAAQVWDERIGSARVQARSWRWTPVGCLGLALVVVSGLPWQLGRSTVTASVGAVDPLGPDRQCHTEGKRVSLRVDLGGRRII